MTIHDRIRALRIKQKLSMEQLGKAVGVTWQTVQQWENGSTAPKRTRQQKVAKVLGVTVEQLIGSDDYPAAHVKRTKPAAVFDVESALPFRHPNALVSQIISLIERLPDAALGEVLRCARETVANYPERSSQKPAG